MRLAKGPQHLLARVLSSPGSHRGVDMDLDAADLDLDLPRPAPLLRCGGGGGAAPGQQHTQSHAAARRGWVEASRVGWEVGEGHPSESYIHMLYGIHVSNWRRGGGGRRQLIASGTFFPF